ncbi:5-methylcytosine-specific restriction endonuclease system specificity protein McrC [soil metagenome]
MAIPIRNLYFLLCYAWDSLEEVEQLHVGEENSPDILDLLARVLDSGLNHCIRRGFDRGYVPRTEVIRGLRGRIDFSASLKGIGFVRGELTCETDDFTVDVLHNQILKATLSRLLKSAICHELKLRLHSHLALLSGVSDVRLSPSLFGRVVLHRNNNFYRFLLDVCLLIYRNSIPDKQGAGYTFTDFTGDGAQMGKLFEAFVRNFIKRRPPFAAWQERIRWNWEAFDEMAYALLPTMETDVCVTGGARKLVIECKFGLVTSSNAFGTERLRREHLFQLHAYLSNLPSSPENSDCRGILLYPSSGIDFDVKYTHLQRSIEVRTLNLDQKWEDISADVVNILEDRESQPVPSL